MKKILMFCLLLVSIESKGVVIPKITKVIVTPDIAVSGKKFKFNVELDINLPSGYKVQISPINDNKFTTMTGKKTIWSLERSIYSIGEQDYQVIIKKNGFYSPSERKIGSYTVTSSKDPTNHSPKIKLINYPLSKVYPSNGTYTVILKGTDIDNNLAFISMDWGDGTVDKLIPKNGEDLVFTHSYSVSFSSFKNGIPESSEYTWKAISIDSSVVPFNSKPISQKVTVYLQNEKEMTFNDCMMIVKSSNYLSGTGFTPFNLCSKYPYF